MVSAHQRLRKSSLAASPIQVVSPWSRPQSISLAARRAARRRRGLLRRRHVHVLGEELLGTVLLVVGRRLGGGADQVLDEGDDRRAQLEHLGRRRPLRVVVLRLEPGEGMWGESCGVRCVG